MLSDGLAMFIHDVIHWMVHRWFMILMVYHKEIQFLNHSRFRGRCCCCSSCCWNHGTYGFHMSGMSHGENIAGWWFGSLEQEFMTFHSAGNFIITDGQRFFRGVGLPPVGSGSIHVWGCLKPCVQKGIFSLTQCKDSHRIDDLTPIVPKGLSEGTTQWIDPASSKATDFVGGKWSKPLWIVEFVEAFNAATVAALLPSGVIKHGWFENPLWIRF